VAISFGRNDNSDMRKRLEATFDQFIDVSAKTDAEIAALLYALEIDIAVDLKGFTQDSRPAILSGRVAPVQVSYLGFPGTLAAPYIDYIIADDVVLPESLYPHFSEKVVALPDSYQVNDNKRAISKTPPTRAECGLPEGAFVFCAFNNSYKITPAFFDIWMRLLKGVEGSVVWLLDSGEVTIANLRR
jgi:predicted O-linked N-acetylglucosamine transferase (SPINDLY family)